MVMVEVQQLMAKEAASMVAKLGSQAQLRLVSDGMGFFFLDISGDSMGFIKLVEQCVRHPCCLVDVFLLLFVGPFLEIFKQKHESTCSRTLGSIGFMGFDMF